MRDSNSRPSGPKPDALPDCANARLFVFITNSMFGGDDRDRTRDLLNANQTLSQLSYIPINFNHISIPTLCQVHI